MELCFENKKMKTFAETFHQTKRVQESAEAVIPDTKEDIGRIAAVQAAVLLKSKDATAHGISVSGEATATIVYITENEDAVSFVELSKSFTIEYDCAGCDEALSSIALCIANTEARVLNPRKLSVVFEIGGELCCWREEETVVESFLPESVTGLHVKSERCDCILHTAVCEKTLAVSEQFVLPLGKAETEAIVSQKAELLLAETQTIGSKLILKGDLRLTVYTLSAGERCPVKSEFTAPFSQIIETGCDNIEDCTASLSLTSIYCDLIDTINGEKAIDTELHAVTQAVCSYKKSVAYIVDAFSNLMPSICCRETNRLCTSFVKETVRLHADERVSLPENCTDVLCIFPSLLSPELKEGKVSANVVVDIIYENTDGAISAVRRTATLADDGSRCGSITGACLRDVWFRPDGRMMDMRLSVELALVGREHVELPAVSSVGFDEENAYDRTSFPSLSVVRYEGEELWELAKKYHSAPERIAEMNGGDPSGRKMLLIPKAL